MGKLRGLLLVFALMFSIAGYAEAAANYWFSPLGAVPDGDSLDLLLVEPAPSAAIRVSSGGEVIEADSQWILLGLTLPSGASGKIGEVEICYQVEAAVPDRTYISQIRLTQMTTPDEVKVIYDDDTDLTATSSPCYKSRTRIKKVNGTVTLALKMVFGSPDDAIQIGGIRLRVSK
jgi:hypothetical protein